MSSILYPDHMTGETILSFVSICSANLLFQGCSIVTPLVSSKLHILGQLTSSQELVLSVQNPNHEFGESLAKSSNANRQFAIPYLSTSLISF